MDSRSREAAAAAAACCATVASCAAAYFTVFDTNRIPTPAYARNAIPRPSFSRCSTPWRRILTYRQVSDFIVSINFPKNLATDRIPPLFELERGNVNWGSPYRRGPKRYGRHPQVDSIDLMGLALWFVKSRDPIYKMCPIFGLVLSSLSVWLDYVLEVLLRVFRKRSSMDFEIHWPTAEEMKQSAALLESNRDNGHVLKGIFGITDDGRMPCAHFIDFELQNAFWECFTQAVEVINVFVSNFKGEIIHAGINFLGSWHDSKTSAASNLYRPKLSEWTPDGFAILADSAFMKDIRGASGKIVRAGKANERDGLPAPAVMAAVDLIIERAMPKERQSAEWGVRAIKAPFKRLSVPLPADSYTRYRLLRVVCHLYNFRVRFVGLYQIRSTFAGTGEEVKPWMHGLLGEETI